MSTLCKIRMMIETFSFRERVGMALDWDIPRVALEFVLGKAKNARQLSVCLTQPKHEVCAIFFLRTIDSINTCIIRTSSFVPAAKSFIKA